MKVDPEELAKSLNQHRSQPHISIDAHVKLRRVELGTYVKQRKFRVYLDLCYWLRLRDIELGRSNDEAVSTLLEKLRGAVRDKCCICPISEVTFLELMKQKDKSTRLATAKLIDELSEGVTLVTTHERINQEVANFFAKHRHPDIYSAEILVWSKLSYVLGVVHPTWRTAEEADSLAIQKSFFDHMWNIQLTDMIELLSEPWDVKERSDRTAASLNALNAEHSPEITNFTQLYRDEFIGALSTALPVARSIIEDAFVHESGHKPERSTEQIENDERQILKLLAAIVNLRGAEAVTAFPTAHIGALCHAATRWDKKRQLKGNDLYDFYHAQAAIPYCNAFITETPLKALLTQKNVDALKGFNCVAIDSAEAATNYLAQLHSQRIEPSL